MAGNTKLMGFGSDNKVTLSRWGKKTITTISQESWERMLYVCKRMLPTEPRRQTVRDSTWFAVRYDEVNGTVTVDMGLDSARWLYKLISGGVVDEELRNWAQAIDAAIRAHHDYHNLDEPGVG